MMIHKIKLSIIHCLSLKNLCLLGLTLLLSACGECDTIQQNYNQGINPSCLFCPIFKVICDAGAEIAEASWNAFAQPLQGVVAIAIVIHIAMVTLKNLGSFKKLTVADYLTGDKQGVLVLTFKAAVIILLLKDTFLLDKVIYPILSSGLEIGKILADKTGLPAISSSMDSNVSGFKGVFDSIYKNLEEFNFILYKNIAIGQTMTCISAMDAIWKWKWLMLAYGTLMILFGWMCLMGLSYYMVDLIIRLAMGAVLLPLGIAFAISSKTSGYAKNIWNIFINTFFNFVLLGIVMGISGKMIEFALGGSQEAGSALNSFLNNLNQKIDANQAEKIGDELMANGSFIILIICFSILLNLYKEIGPLASKISDTPAGDLGSAAATTGALLTAPAVKKGKEVGGRMLKGGLNDVKAIGEFGKRVTRADKLGRKIQSGLSSMRGFLTGTGDKSNQFMFNDRNRARVSSWLRKFGIS